MRKIAVLGFLSVIPASQALVMIDDFGGQVTSVETSSTTTLVYSSGTSATVPGGVRHLGQSFTGTGGLTATAIAAGSLFVSTPTNAETRTALAYGNIDGPTRGSGPTYWPKPGPNFSLGGFDTLRLNFLANEQDLFVVFVIQADFSSEVYMRTVAGGQATPFSLDILASDKVQDSATASLSNFDTLFISFRTSNGGDFELSSLQAVPEPTTMAILGLGLTAAAARRRRK